MSYDLQLDNGDVVVDLQGDVIVLEGYDKLNQDLQRLMVTSHGDNKFDVNEGCGVIDLLGKALPRDLAEMILNKDIYMGLKHMIDQQNAQSLIQVLSAYEQIATIDAIVLKQISLKAIEFDIVLTTARGLEKAFAVSVK